MILLKQYITITIYYYYYYLLLLLLFIISYCLFAQDLLSLLSLLAVIKCAELITSPATWHKSHP